MSLLQTIEFSNFGKFATFRSAHNGDGCEVEARFGLLNFDVSSMGGTRVVITVKRKSGNGVFAIVSGGNVINAVAMSKVAQNFEIKTEGKFSIIRPFTSVGIISVLSISVYDDYGKKEEEEAMMKWKDLLNRASEYSAFRMVKGNLVASDGAYIKAGKIYQVETLPPNCYVLSENETKVTFVRQCQVVALQFDKGLKPTVTNKIIPLLPNQEIPVKQQAVISNRSIISSSSYRDDYRNFSIFTPEPYESVFSDISLNLTPKTYEMHSWVSKWIKMFPNVTVDSVQFEGLSSVKSDKTVLLTDVNNLFNYQYIFLEEFTQSLDQSKRAILSTCKTIFTPSLMNAQYLRTFCNNVIYLPKYWPYKPVEKSPQNHILVFCRDERVGNLLDDSLRGDFLFVGNRGIVVNKSVGDSLSYGELLSLIMNAKAVIDVSKNLHYYSGLLDLCMIAKKPIITNNHWLSVCKPAVRLVDNVLNSVGEIEPSIAHINSYLNIQNTPANYDMESYNYNLLSTLRIIQEEML